MGRIIVEWGKFQCELPAEFFLFLLFKAASLLLHNLNA